MGTPIRWIPAIGAVALLAGAWPGAAFAQTSPAEARMRDQLRQTVTQMRALEDENAALKAQVATLQQQVAAQAAKPAVPVEDHEASRRLEGDLRASEARSAELTRRSDQMDQALAQWKQGYEQAAGAYRTRDADAKRLEAQLEQTSAHATACDANNAELVAIGNELVKRYKDKTLGDWAADREPLTQLGSVRFEELAQQYHAKITQLAVPPLVSRDGGNGPSN